MDSLKTILARADGAHHAIGHFNISDSVAFRAIIAAARELSVPVLIGTSEGERAFLGPREAVALVRSAREAYGLPVFLNADHTHSLEKVREAASAGYDEILFDASHLPFEENVEQTKQAVAIVKSINPDILVEGEIGYIGSSSEILKEIPEGAALSADRFTTPEEAVQFVHETGVDVLAPAVGNMHGLLESMVQGDVQKHLDIERIAAIKSQTRLFLTLHGGSGTADRDFKEAIRAGMTIIHVSTELRLAWRKGVEEGLASQPQEIAPYKILGAAEMEIKKVVKNRLALFSNMSLS